MKEIYHVTFKNFHKYKADISILLGTFTSREKAEKYATEYSESENSRTLKYERSQEYRVKNNIMFEHKAGSVNLLLIVHAAPLNPVYGRISHG